MANKDPISGICSRVARIREQYAGSRGKASFARELGLSPSTYDYYETKRVPPADVLLRISELAHVDVRWLLTGMDYDNTNFGVKNPVVLRISQLLKDCPICSDAIEAFVDAMELAMPANAKIDHEDRVSVVGGPGLSARGSAGTAGGSADSDAIADLKSGPNVAETAGAGSGLITQVSLSAIAEGAGGEAGGGAGGEAGVDVGAVALSSSDGKAASNDKALSSGSAKASDLVAGVIPKGSMQDRRGEVIGVPVPSNEVPGEHQGWIPVLGRSAAGVPHFWADVPGVGTDAPAGESGDITMLADLVATMKPRQTRQVRPARAAGDLAPGSSAQLVLLDAPEAPGTAEFVIAEHIADRYHDLFAVRIDGESMDPEVCHGDVVVLSPHCPAEQGYAAVIQLADQIGVTCKLVRYDGDMLHLIPVNETFSPTVHHANSVQWALKVIACIRPV